MKHTFRRAFRADTYLLLHSGALWAALAVPLLILMDSPEDFIFGVPHQSTSVYYHFFHSISYGGLFGPYLIPMLCALPYAASLCDERATGAWRSSLSRGSRRSYFLSRFLVAALSGALLYGLGLSLFFALTSLVLPFFQPEDLEFFENFFYRSAALRHPGLFAGIAIVYAFFSGAIYAAFATAVSAFTPSRSAVIASPFVLAFGWVHLDVLTAAPLNSRPMIWLIMRSTINGQIGTEGLTFLACLGFTVLFVLLAGIIFCRRGKKVLEGA